MISSDEATLMSPKHVRLLSSLLDALPEFKRFQVSLCFGHPTCTNLYVVQETTACFLSSAKRTNLLKSCISSSEDTQLLKYLKTADDAMQHSFNRTTYAHRSSSVSVIVGCRNRYDDMAIVRYKKRNSALIMKNSINQSDFIEALVSLFWRNCLSCCNQPFVNCSTMYGLGPSHKPHCWEEGNEVKPKIHDGIFQNLCWHRNCCGEYCHHTDEATCCCSFSPLIMQSSDAHQKSAKIFTASMFFIQQLAAFL